jgi:hypothetical protein
MTVGIGDIVGSGLGGTKTTGEGVAEQTVNLAGRGRRGEEEGLEICCGVLDYGDGRVGSVVLSLGWIVLSRSRSCYPESSVHYIITRP